MFETIWNTIFYHPVLNLLVALYHLLGDNLGLAIIAIAIIFRLILIPFTNKQMSMTRKMSSLKPQLEELQAKFKNNPQKLSEEQVKLYKKVGYNPLGCLFTLIPQLIILSVLIGVIRSVTSNSFEGLYPFIRDYVSTNGQFIIDTKFIIWDLARGLTGKLSSEQLTSVQQWFALSPFEIIGEYLKGGINQETMALFYKLGMVDQYGWTSIYSIYYMILAALVGISQFFSGKFTQLLQNPNPESAKKAVVPAGEVSPDVMQKQMMQSMNWLFPVMTVFIAVSAPAALSLYWIVQSVMLIVQFFILDWDKSKKGIQNLVTLWKNRLKKRK